MEKGVLSFGFCEPLCKDLLVFVVTHVLGVHGFVHVYIAGRFFFGMAQCWSALLSGVHGVHCCLWRNLVGVTGKFSAECIAVRYHLVHGAQPLALGCATR